MKIVRLREPPHTMVFLAAFTGLWIRELLGLKWADIDFRGSKIDVRRAVVYGVVGKCKSKASRRPVALDQVLADALLRWSLKTPYSKPDDWVFASTHLNGERPLNPGMLRRGPRQKVQEYRERSAGTRSAGLWPLSSSQTVWT